MDLENDFTRTETEQDVKFKSKKPNKRGFIINISFTKNEKEHEDSMKAIKEFFVREVF